jgi:putative ABC transport system permease protein
MDYFIFIIKSSIDDFTHNKLRTFLTSLGLLIGVASVVLLVAMGLGLKRYIEQQFESLGANLLIIMPGNMESGGLAASAPIGGANFDNSDVNNLGRIPSVKYSVPFFVKFTKAQGDKDSSVYEIAATTADISEVINFNFSVGNAFKKSDAERGNKVVVIGQTVAEKLFGSAENSLGKTVKIENQGFRVVGVFKTKGGGGIGGSGLDNRILMPYKAAASFNPDKKIYAIYLKVDTADNLASAKNEVKKVLLKRYKSSDFSVMEQTEILSTINSIFSVLNAILVAIAGISLVVGGIGVMNIMYVSVAERTHEIGIRRAIGATKHDMLFQFLAEAVILSILGGTLGLLFSSLIVLLMQRFFPAYIDPLSVTIAIGVSSTIGLIFGVLPARKAAELSPIEAIRYE